MATVAKPAERIAPRAAGPAALRRRWWGLLVGAVLLAYLYYAPVTLGMLRTTSRIPSATPSVAIAK